MRNRPDCSISLCICKRSLSRLHHSNRLTKASALSFSCLGKLAQAALRTSGPIRDGARQVRRFFRLDELQSQLGQIKELLGPIVQPGGTLAKPKRAAAE